MPKCGYHPEQDMVWKLISPSSKPGAKQFDPFYKWSCDQKMPDGSFCNFRCNDPGPATSEEKFENGLNEMNSNDAQKKLDEKLTRIAVVKSMIEAGYKTGPESLETLEWWIDTINNKKAPVAPVSASHDPDELTDDDIPF